MIPILDQAKKAKLSYNYLLRVAGLYKYRYYVALSTNNDC
jgi:hypothetical protein